MGKGISYVLKQKLRKKKLQKNHIVDIKTKPISNFSTSSLVHKSKFDIDCLTGQLPATQLFLEMPRMQCLASGDQIIVKVSPTTACLIG